LAKYVLSWHLGPAQTNDPWRYRYEHMYANDWGVILKAEGNPSYSPTLHKVNFDFSSNQAAGKAVIAFLYLYVANFAISWATPAWVVPAKFFPMITLGRANSMTTAVN